MSFRTALTGLNAASADLGVISNNIANNNTTGFKQSRAEFGDIYSLSDLGTSTRRSVGTGVKLNSVTQLFKQGNLETTSNPLDLAIDGEGFFSLKETDGSMVYTRAGSFGLDKDGYIVNSRTQRLQGYLTNPTTGNIDIGNTGDLQTQTGNIKPNQTTTGEFGINLDSGAISRTAPISSFDFRDSRTYDFASAMTIFDSLGNDHSLTAYFAKSSALPAIVPYTPVTTPVTAPTTSAWPVFFSMDGLSLDGSALPPATAAIPSGYLCFDAFGKVTGTLRTTTTKVPGTGIPTPGVYTPANFGSSTPPVMTPGTGLTSVPVNSVPAEMTWTTTITERTAITETITSYTVTTTDTRTKSINLAGIIPTNGPNPIKGDWNGAVSPINVNGTPSGVTMKFDNTTQYGSPSSTNAATQDGYATGRIVGVDVGEDGTMNGRYSNGQAKVLGQVTLANFRSTPGLSPIGDTSWVETAASGQPTPGPPGTASLGLVRAGALELSNVELSEQLVKMINAQRNFQANAQVISTADQMTQTLLNMR
ncbi:MAG: flagellar hook protein FlgE [Candidatus Competibacteraceae bacterium]